MPQRIEGRDRLLSMTTKAVNDRHYDAQAANAARSALRAYVDANGGQKDVAKAFGVNQSTISKSLSPSKQPSLKVLMALRLATGKTLDELLGLRAPQASSDLDDVRRELAAIRALMGDHPPRSSAKAAAR